MSHILRRLPQDEFEIDVVAINYAGDPDYDRKKYPGALWPASNIDPVTMKRDPLGRQRVVDLVTRKPYDTVFILQDLWVASQVMPALAELQKKSQFKIVYYIPVDAPPWIKWVEDSAALADVAVTYTQYGKEACLAASPKMDVAVIPHGVDFSEFHYLEDRDDVNGYRSYWYPATMGKFLLTNINRNQPRKDIPRTLMMLHELKKLRDDVALYLHMSKKDIGGDFTPIANQLGLIEGQDFFLPHQGKKYGPDGVSVNELNIIYNMSDAIITTSAGEGWGLSLTESMATKTPVVAPDHTSITEILGDGERGYLVSTGEDINMWGIISSDHLVLRPLVDVKRMAETIDVLIKCLPCTEKVAERSYQWVIQNLNWDDIAMQWEGILRAD